MAHVLDGDFTPLSAVDIFVKDLGLVLDTARASISAAARGRRAPDVHAGRRRPRARGRRRGGQIFSVSKLPGKARRDDARLLLTTSPTTSPARPLANKLVRAGLSARRPLACRPARSTASRRDRRGDESGTAAGRQTRWRTCCPRCAGRRRKASTQSSTRDGSTFDRRRRATSAWAIDALLAAPSPRSAARSLPPGFCPKTERTVFRRLPVCRRRAAGTRAACAINRSRR